MKNHWLKNKALKNAAENMIDMYFRGNMFKTIDEILAIYNRESFTFFADVYKKYGLISINAKIIAIEESGNLHVDKIVVTST